MLGYGLDMWGSFPGRARENICFCHHIQTGFGNHPPSYLMVARDKTARL